HDRRPRRRWDAHRRQPEQRLRRGSRGGGRPRAPRLAAGEHVYDRQRQAGGGGKRMTRFPRRRAALALAAAGLVAALVVPATSIGSGTNAYSPPTKIGKGEGALNVIEWP